jgi:O-6-methylguanine DNA methyltransferase
LPVATPDGVFLAEYSEAGLRGLSFPSAKRASKSSAGVAHPPAQLIRWHQLTSEAVNGLLSGRGPRRLPPLDISVGTDFQQQVWTAMGEIPFGRTSSYGELARAIGRPKATRAVGTACGANPIPLLVPCHRVLAANNRLGGFSSGLDWKRLLLGREGVAKQGELWLQKDGE